jgi:hypothetical protein
MPKLSEGTIALGGLALLAIWLFIVLPILYLPREIHAQQQIRPIQRAENVDVKPDGSPQSPFSVQVIPAPKSAEERAQEAEDREEKKSADRWLVRWTAALFIATAGLIVATGVLGYFAYRQLRDMKDSIAAATDSAKQARRSADVAERTLALTTRPWISMRLPDRSSLTTREQQSTSR